MKQCTLLGLGLMVWLMVGCTHEAYERGDGLYSYLRADFGMLHTMPTAHTDYLITDDGQTVHFASPGKLNWPVRPDSFYRALVYYDSKGKEMMSAHPVTVTTAQSVDRMDGVKKDPLTVESVWIGGRYLNMRLAVKVGNMADTLRHQHKIGLTRLSDALQPNGTSKVQLQLIHDQNNVPAYYMVTTYLSMPLDSYAKGSEIIVKAMTYKGEKAFKVTY